ncbi:molecular chaperone GrpE [Clostridium acetobutylicum]|uniref:GrpE protein HSP-70 cofactor n=1 Tax=Clostridium acetobutylicum (strain ATCC 824 / DSM 792 / JCM 1419 / IAM 19013 / LMG 5710 / NBRC 13948 / NRRL B-527 / VKM B-1787 / 2291 / W) TaxID=272562 RepID=Q97LT3_CLOAB|nr:MULTISPECIES: nucleotide exchange factor GrpE [Clostridium]AAK78451.1 GrpE protein HSP-70 cofactor [Clostridium acetobutylicum ATCC 824]ADZ19521.1 GrpE protein HSP-70 cofactor [Clostridium acetobutylicum EA 2018]AEI31261.1 GrpE protein HSP-70 cofactor [Clostridium acetobutylicum DSM 1731]AWV80173.1 nucleotide exchange factor GrpE [Clostridium acetobutylicum]KHD37755.1 molecular chaperone GrpE [Clostridium acetobutylicum]
MEKETLENPVLEELVKKIEEKTEEFALGVEKLTEEFESKVKYDKHKDEIIDNLHEELQSYRNDIIGKMIKPLITDIIYTIDNNNKTCEALKDKDGTEFTKEKVLQIVGGLSEDLEDMLYRQGVEDFTFSFPEFDPKKQKVVKTVETDDKNKDRTVSKSIKKGYIWDGKVIRHELVEVYVYNSNVSKEQEE